MFPRICGSVMLSLAGGRAREGSMATNADEVRQVAARGYWRESDARLLIEAWRSSGETLVRFARRHRVEHKRLARWVSRLDGAGSGRLLLHPVRLVDNRLETGAPIEIQF